MQTHFQLADETLIAIEDTDSVFPIGKTVFFTSDPQTAPQPTDVYTVIAEGEGFIKNGTVASGFVRKVTLSPVIA